MGYLFSNPGVCARFGAQNGKSTAVLVTDLTGVVLGRFETLTAAAAFMGVTSAAVCKAVKKQTVVQKQYLVIPQKS